MLSYAKPSSKAGVRFLMNDALDKSLLNKINILWVRVGYFDFSLLYTHKCSMKTQHSSFGIATGWTAGARDFYLLHSVQHGSRAILVSYTMGTGASFSGSKAAGATSAEVKNGGAIPTLLHTS
jgi:hypothetical protein